MTNVLILGSSGRIARHVVDRLSSDSDASLTLLQRRDPGSRRIANAGYVVGSVLDADVLGDAMAGQDIVYANLTGGDIDDQARAIIAAMQAHGVPRLIFVLSLGIYDEVPGDFGEWNNQMLSEVLLPFSRAAEIIEASDRDYTIIRPAWLSDENSVEFETTTRHEPFRGTEVSRQAVAALIAQIIVDPTTGSRDSLGVSKPGTEGAKPSFM